MKLDASLAVEGKHLPRIDETGRAAESLGFAGLWTSETKHDSFLPLAVAANTTERLSLGTSVAIAFSRSPMVTAQVAWDLRDLSERRPEAVCRHWRRCRLLPLPDGDGAGSLGPPRPLRGPLHPWSRHPGQGSR